MNKIQLRNNGQSDCNLYYPRLQVNKHGEIVLALYKQGILTVGILVDKTPESKSTLPIGQRLEDWEVCGTLIDYDGEVQLALSNRVPTEAFEEIIGGGHGGLVTQRRVILQKANNTTAEEAEKANLTTKIEAMNAEREQIVERFYNRQQIEGDKERLREINAMLW